MRRPFPRTSGSPQAPAIVETPAHYAPTLFCRLTPLSEVVIGSVEPTMSLHSLRNASTKIVKKIEKAAIFVQKILKLTHIRIILAENVLGLKIICIALFDNIHKPTAMDSFSLFSHDFIEYLFSFALGF